MIEQGITVRKSVGAFCPSLQAILDNRSDEISLRMRKLILGRQQDWIWTDKRTEMTTSEIKSVSESEASCQRLMTIPGLEAAATRMPRNKLGVALANKLARTAWSVLNSSKDFDWKEKEFATAI